MVSIRRQRGEPEAESEAESESSDNHPLENWNCCAGRHPFIFRMCSQDSSRKNSEEEDDDDDEPSGGVGEKAELEEPLPADDADPSTSKKAEEREALAKASTPKKLGPQSPLRVVPPSPSTDNVAPRLKLPGSAAAKVAKSEANTKKPAKKEDGLGRIPDVDELAKRFAELKR